MLPHPLIKRGNMFIKKANIRFLAWNKSISKRYSKEKLRNRFLFHGTWSILFSFRSDLSPFIWFVPIVHSEKQANRHRIPNHWMQNVWNILLEADNHW